MQKINNTYVSKITGEKVTWEDIVQLINDADKGNTFAQRELKRVCVYSSDSRFLVENFGIPPTPANAQTYLRLGKMYLRGIHIRKNNKAAIRCYHYSAVVGNIVEAQMFLGKAYHDGEIVNRDYTLSFGYFKLAADQGNAEAEFCLGKAYFYGDGIMQDYKSAFSCLTSSAAKGYQDAVSFLYEQKKTFLPMGRLLW